MDVEDNELFVLKGASETLKNSNYPKILFECNGGPKSQDLFNYIKNLNYKIIKIENYGNMYLAEYDSNYIADTNIPIIVICYNNYTDTKNIIKN